MRACMALKLFNTFSHVFKCSFNLLASFFSIVFTDRCSSLKPASESTDLLVEPQRCAIMIGTLAKTEA